MEKEDSTNAEIIYHFDVEQHSIPLVQFIDTAKATKSILDDFNHQIFNGKLKYSLEVLPSEEGGFKSVIKISIITGGIIWGFLSTDMGSGYIEGLTNHKPEYWLKTFGEEHQRLFNLIYNASDKPVKMDKTDRIDALSKEIEAKFLSALPLYLLSKSTEELKTVGITPDIFYKAFKAKNKFYKACQNNIEVRGLSFDRLYDFPIKRDDFKNFIVDKPVESSQWFFETTNVAVNSPNWENAKKRKWQGKDSKNRPIMFVIKDDFFWQRVRDNKIDPTIKDIMQVQWIYQIKDGKRKDIQVIKVISFNDDTISKPLPDEEVQNKYKAEKKSLDGSLDLFVVQTDEDKNNSSND